MSEEPSEPRGLRAIGAAGLGMEGLTVLLEAPGVAGLKPGHAHAAAIAYLLALGVVLLVAAGLMRRPWGRSLGTALQVPVVVAGVFAWPLYVVGAVFAAIWAYYLSLWRRP